MFLSEIGRIANGFWIEISHHFLYIILDEFVVMPDHVHGIVISDKNNDNKNNDDDNNGNDNDNNNIETRHCLVSIKPGSEPEKKSPGQKRFRNPGKDTVSSIIGSYKSAVSKQVHLFLPAFGW